MNPHAIIAALTLPVLICSCATSCPPQAFRAGTEDALVIESYDDHSGQVVSPVTLERADNRQMLNEIKSVEKKSVAIVMLEGYQEPQPGPEFRDRSLELFMGLRQLGYQRIIFLQGHGVPQPSGLMVLAQYF
jgi:hypothetical protein